MLRPALAEAANVAECAVAACFVGQDSVKTDLGGQHKAGYLRVQSREKTSGPNGGPRQAWGSASQILKRL